ncbi:MAG: hypothetical protein B7Y80_16920 [Hyphomicrobium sp. 32-62-53]|nr:MAG: hypothetical protein B7Z29_08030 [Hyphomicrobium sp. 12-62-95]OYX98058.1 MAG: hypothetical protein B7Y80_16920 [Hyphomicrobium sp. 32-62-53]
MQLIKHDYGGRKPARYYIDSRRVARDAYELAILENRVGHGQHCCFVTKIINRVPGFQHSVHFSCLSSARLA